MSLLFLSLFLLSPLCQGEPAKPGAFPALPLELRLSQPRRPPAALKIRSLGSRYEIEYRRAGQAGSVKRSFDRDTIAELLAILDHEGESPAKWAADGSCFHKRNFLLLSGGKKIPVCAKGPHLVKLDDFFLAAEQLLNREEGGGE
jgi:hypothetical protein